LRERQPSLNQFPEHRAGGSRVRVRRSRHSVRRARNARSSLSQDSSLLMLSALSRRT
jgi:hypothetical protein